MKIQADENGALECPELFPAFGVFDAVELSDGSICLKPLPTDEPPLVKPIRTPEGFLILPVKITSAEAARAVRMDRDAQ